MSLTKLTKGDAVKLVSSDDLLRRLVAEGWVIATEAQTEAEAPAEVETEAPAKRGRGKKA
jgi:hypothetical protein